MKKLVFWHGWGVGPAVWTDLVEQLRGLLNNPYELVVQPLPGYTPEQEPVVYYSASGLLEDLMKEITEPITLCGWSLGAMLALLAASLFPERIEKLILIGATPRFMKRTDWSEGVPLNMIDKLGSSLRVDPASTLRRFITIFNQNDIHAREIARKLTDITSAPAPSLESGLDLLKHTDLRPIVQNISQPVLLLHGEKDPLMPLSAAKWLQKHLKQAQLAVLPQASHAPFLSDTLTSAQFISDFLNAAH